MRVFQIEGDWGIDNLCLAERPDPTPGANEVLVSMRAAALNSRDLIVPERGYGRATGELPLIPVSDGAGEVVATGEAARVKSSSRTVISSVITTTRQRPPTALTIKAGQHWVILAALTKTDTCI